MSLADTDLADPSLIADPQPFHDAARAASPVLAMASGVHLVTSYELVQEAAGRPEDFSSDIAVLFAGTRAEHPQVKAVLEQGWPQLPVLIMADPPPHSRYRRLVSQAFSLPRVDAIAAASFARGWTGSRRTVAAIS